MSDLLLNFLVSIAGWLAFNAIMLSMHKDENEETFNIRSYTKKTWDNWLASLFCIPILLWIGHEQLSLDVEGSKIEWTDLYYVCSGFAVEAIKSAYKKWKNKIG